MWQVKLPGAKEVEEAGGKIWAGKAGGFQGNFAGREHTSQRLRGPRLL